MHVIATAGHVDHGKSTLVRALTGQDPDRLREEHRRGLSIELGYCWLTLPGAGEVAFVDVPGHERFVSTMLAGVGPVPAVLFVVAADDPWMPQAAEHLAALQAFGVRSGVVAVTRADLADPGPAMERASHHLRDTSLRHAVIIPVSARTGAGLPELRRKIVDLVAALPAAPVDASVRIWVDRRFHIAGAGTVVTGTLPAGTLRVGDQLAHDGVPIRVRGIETLGRDVEEVCGVSRVALRLGGNAPVEIRRGSALVSPGGWHLTALADVRLTGSEAPPERPLVHVGAASLEVRCRHLGDDVWRLQLPEKLPLHVGDRAVVRDPGSRALWGAVVLDPAPPALDRRGAAARRTAELAETTGSPDVADELRRRRVARVSELRRYGVDVLDDGPAVGLQAQDWLLDGRAVPELQTQIRQLVADQIRNRPLDPGVPLTVAAKSLGLPSTELLAQLVPADLTIVAGRVLDSAAALPAPLLAALERLEEQLAQEPFAAPDANRLAELGLDTRAIAAATRADRLLRLGETIVLLPGADEAAAALLQELPQPFTTSQARSQLRTSRRVALPLLELLDDRGLTRRLPDDRRTVVASSSRT